MPKSTPNSKLTFKSQMNRRVALIIGGVIAALAMFAGGYLLAMYLVANNISAPFAPAPAGGCGGRYRGAGPLILMCPLTPAN